MRNLSKLIFIALLMLPSWALAAATTTSQVTLLPLSNNYYDIGTSTKNWNNLYVTQICLSGDTCRTTWPSGSGSNWATTSSDYWISQRSTTNLPEGSNLYYTSARDTANFVSNLAGTTSVASITTLANLSLPAAQLTGFGVPFYSFFHATTTDALSEGLSNLYFTTARATSNFVSNLAATTSVSSITALPNLALPATQLSSFGIPFYQFFSATNTSALAEGSNLYFTTARATSNFISNLAATTSIKSIITLNSLSLPVTQVTGISASYPLSYSSGAFSFNGLGTTSPFTIGQVPYVNSSNTLTSVATSSITYSAPLTTSGTAGYIIGGSGYTIGCQTASGSQAGCLSSSDWTTFNNKGSGTVTSITLSDGLFGTTPLTTTGTIYGSVATSATPTIGNLAYWTSVGDATHGAHLGTVATTSVGCSGFITCTGFYGLGSASTITTTGQLSIASGGTNNGTAPATNVLMYYNGTGIVGTSSSPLYVDYLTATSTTATSTFNGGVNFKGTIQASATQPATSTAIVIDWANTPPQLEYRIGTSATTITFTNGTTSTQWGSRKLVWVCNPGASAGALTWAGVEWIGAAPTQTTTLNQCDTYSFDVTHATSSSAYKIAGTAGTGFQ